MCNMTLNTGTWWAQTKITQTLITMDSPMLQLNLPSGTNTLKWFKTWLNCKFLFVRTLSNDKVQGCPGNFGNEDCVGAYPSGGWRLLMDWLLNMTGFLTYWHTGIQPHPFFQPKLSKTRSKCILFSIDPVQQDDIFFNSDDIREEIIWY